MTSPDAKDAQRYAGTIWQTHSRIVADHFYPAPRRAANDNEGEEV